MDIFNFFLLSVLFPDFHDLLTMTEWLYKNVFQLSSDLSRQVPQTSTCPIGTDGP